MKRLIRTAISYIAAILSYIVPKRKDIWIYIPSHFRDIKGNIQAQYDFVASHDKGIKQYFIVSDISKLPKTDANKKYMPFVVQRTSLRGVVLFLRAAVIFIDTGKGESKGRFNIVQLWHGTGLKNIHALGNNGKKKYKPNKNIILVAATSEADRVRKEKSFVTPHSVITGAPRNDFLFSDNINVYTNKLKEKIDISGFKKILSYVPTYRESENFTPFTTSGLEKLNDSLIRNNYVLLIKVHPDKPNKITEKNFSNIIDITNMVKDAHDLFLLSDIMISDYSGVTTDFALTNNPIIFYIYDFEEYSKNLRSFYYDLMETLPGPFAYTEDELISLIDNTDWSSDKLYINKLFQFRDIFHCYKDNNSSERVYEYVIKYLKY